jgi:uncharacterized protein (TIGR03086 family)
MREADRYRSLSDSMTATIAGVPDGGWDVPTPCEDWTARDIVRHLVDTSGMFLGFIGQDAPAGPSIDDDPLGAFTTARDAVQAALDDPATATQEYDGMFGPTTFAKSVDGFLSADLVIHRWDLARATGQDDTLDADLCAELLAGMEPLEDLMRSSGHYGPRVAVDPEASAQDRMLGFIGRDPAWRAGS